MIRTLITRALLLVITLVSLFSFYRIGLVYGAPASWVTGCIGAFVLALAVLSLYGQRRLPPLGIAILLCIGVIAFSTLFGQGFGCTRCSGFAHHIRSGYVGIIEPALITYRNENGAYPESLDEIGPIYVHGITGADYEYRRVGDSSYEVCASFYKRYFYGYQIDSGKKHCATPDNRNFIEVPSQ